MSEQYVSKVYKGLLVSLGEVGRDMGIVPGQFWSVEQSSADEIVLRRVPKGARKQ